MIKSFPFSCRFLFLFLFCLNIISFFSCCLLLFFFFPCFTGQHDDEADDNDHSSVLTDMLASDDDDDDVVLFEIDTDTPTGDVDYLLALSLSMADTVQRDRS
jgi:hypothetical protein